MDDTTGIGVIPTTILADLLGEQVLRDGRGGTEAEAAQTLDRWEAEHHARIEKLHAEHGFGDSATVRKAGE